MVVTEAAARSLSQLIESHSLPDDTRARLRRTLAPLEQFPRLGPALDTAEPDRRFVLGPWRWMIIVYQFRQAEDIVAVLAFEDGRSAHASTSKRR